MQSLLQSTLLDALRLEIETAQDNNTFDTVFQKLVVLSLNDSSRRVSRRTCVHLGRNAVLKSPDTVCNVFLDLAHKICKTSTSSIAPVDSFVFLEWTNMLLCSLPARSEFLRDLIQLQAHLLSSCCQEGIRAGLCKSASQKVSRCLDQLKGHWGSPSAVVSKYLEELLGSTRKTSHAHLLGQVINFGAKNSVSSTLEQSKPGFVSFYIQEYLMSKGVVAESSCRGLEPLFTNLFDQQDMEDNIVPAVLKAILRAPEITLEPVVTHLLETTRPSDFAITKLFVDQMAKPLLQIYKSTNQETRRKARVAFEALQNRSGVPTDDLLHMLMSGLVSNRPGVDERLLLTNSIKKLQYPIKTKYESVVHNILPLLAKETNDSVQIELIQVLLSAVENTAVVNSQILDAISRGINDRKSAIRNTWLCSLADFCMRDVQSFSQFFVKNESELLNLWQSFTKAPLAVVQAGWLAGCYATMIILLKCLANTDISGSITVVSEFRDSLYTSEKTSPIFSSKIYTKADSPSEISWLLRALKTLLDEAHIQEWLLISDLWSTTLLTIEVDHKKKEELARAKVVSIQEVLSSSLSKCSQQLVWNASSDTRVPFDNNLASTLISNNTRISIAGLSPAVSDPFKDEILIGLLIVAHHPCMGSDMFWVKICQAIGRDPADVLRNNLHLILDTAFGAVEIDGNHAFSPRTEAALNAVASIAFIDHENSVPIILAHLQTDLQDKFTWISPETIGIWHTPEGQTFADVNGLGKQQKPSINKNTRDWETVAWEESVRTSNAHRRVLPQTLNKADRAKFDSQLVKEQSIRSAISADIAAVLRGLALIDCLNKDFISVDDWFIPAITCLLGPLLTSTVPFIGAKVAETYLSCAARITDLGSDGRLLGLAILMTRNPEANEPAKRDLINRVLYKLRYASEQTVLQVTTVAYAQPLLNYVLLCSDPKRINGTGCSTDDQIEEQIFLALEILDRNVAVFAEVKLDRISTIQALVSVIEGRPSQISEIRTILQTILDTMAQNASAKERVALSKYFCSEDTEVRNAILAFTTNFDFNELGFSAELWLVMHDVSEQNAEFARALFLENNMVVGPETRQRTLPYLKSKNRFEQICASKALAHTFESQPEGLNDLLEHLFSLYIEAAAIEPPEFDRFGQIVVKPQKQDETHAIRSIVAIATANLTTLPIFTVDHASMVAKFMLHKLPNNRRPLSDSSAKVCALMLETGIRVIQRHEEAAVEEMLPLYENALQTNLDDEGGDLAREAAVVLYGCAASFLAPEDQRIPKVIEQLLSTLSAPSESVQLAIAQCLPSLVRNISEQEQLYVHDLLSTLSDGKTYAERRGAAFGLAGIVKGCGVNSLQDQQIMEALQAAILNKKSFKARQGSLLAYECFAQLLGNLWEPYIEGIIPLLLLTYADTDIEVRKATQETSRAIMSRISGYGVQLILPSLLSGLEDHQWRSKKGSVELLGAMAYCAPQQLSISLPTIVPRLNEVLTDSHAQVRAAGNESLLRFGQVISNPEIQVLVPVLLKALSDPNSFTETALDKLLKTSFLHYIDAPSLSILVPILQRGMQERSANTKKKASKIFGLLSSLTSPNDLAPHLGSLLPCLRLVLVDTVPDVRATAAKALGSLVEKLGERHFPDLVDTFLETLNSEVASTDRQGAAQGLSEVLAGLGLERLEDTLPKILKDSRSRFSYVREGFISLLIYLPATFGTRFAPYLAKSIAPILAGLADESEFVRDASLRAGKIMIANYASKSVDLMLPELESGMFNDSWRIRVSSLQLLGDLLYKISGISTNSKADDEDEDDAVATDAQRNTLITALGSQRRDRVFASLYITRFDSFAMVRSSAINVWKTLVANTPKTLRDILPALIDKIIQSLAIRDPEKRLVFIEALGDLMRKMGQDMLTQLLPAFEDGLRSSDADKIGVCVAITEVIQSISSDQIDGLQHRLVSAVKSVLIDTNYEVRRAASNTFDTLQTQFGSTVIDQVLPDLLVLLKSETHAEEALEALKGLMQARSHVILPILLPGLLQRPMTSFNLQAIGSLVKVAGQALNRRLEHLLGTILDAEINNEAKDAASDAFEIILLSIHDGADSVATVMNILFDLIKHDDFRKRARTCVHLAVFFTQTKVDYSRYVADWIRVLLTSFADHSPEVVESSWLALDSLTKALRKEQMPSLIPQVRRTLQSVCTSNSNLAGFSLPKGIGAILPILLQGLLYGSSELKEEAACAICEVIQRTDALSLKVYVTQITGPLIRIIGERAASEVKSSILTTLHQLLRKIPAALKPFLPQLQRTFTKSLADSNDSVRVKAAAALGSLITLQTTRVDPLLAELVTGSQSAEIHTRTAMLSALFEVVGKVGSSISQQSKTNIILLIKRLSVTEDKLSSAKAADLLGVLFRNIENTTQAFELLHEVVLVEPPTRFSITSLNGLLLNSGAKISGIGVSTELVSHLSRSVLSTEPTIAESSILATGKFLLSEQIHREIANEEVLLQALSTCIKNNPSGSSDSQRLSLIVLRAVAKSSHATTRYLDDLGLSVFGCVRSMILPVKLAAEAAFVAIFDMVESGNELLDPFLERQDSAKARSIGEYAKRVATKVATAENERASAGLTRRDEDMDEIMGTEIDESDLA